MQNPGGPFDAIVIGSGFGGCLAAQPLVDAGARVLMLERGGWVERGAQNWGEEGAFVLTPHYTTDSEYKLRTRFGWRPQGLCSCVGGPSVFYGGASFRFRERDFEVAPEVVGDSGAEWPLTYSDLEKHYDHVEELLGIAGETGRDPTEPPRAGEYPQRPPPLAKTAHRIHDAASAIGLRPFRIPMAIHGGRCQSCTTCDAFACAVEAKNDLATVLLPRLVEKGLTLRPRTVVTRMDGTSGWIRAVEGMDAETGERLRFEAPRVILAAGALATPHLLFASGLDALSPAGDAVIGRYLMRHCNAMMYGYFRTPPNPDDEHHKQVAIHDYYFGDPARPSLGKLGNIQQVMGPPRSLIRSLLPRPLGAAVGKLAGNLTGLLVIAEDQPRAGNRVELDTGVRDRFGLPGARITHSYSRRDRLARRALLRRAREILRQAGALFTATWNVNTFSHALGTARMGPDPRTSAVDDTCRFRGVENLWITDGSVLPTSAGVNPSLTIAANAHRVGALLAEQG